MQGIDTCDGAAIVLVEASNARGIFLSILLQGGQGTSFLIVPTGKYGKHWLSVSKLLRASIGSHNKTGKSVSTWSDTPSSSSSPPTHRNLVISSTQGGNSYKDALLDRPSLFDLQARVAILQKKILNLHSSLAAAAASQILRSESGKKKVDGILEAHRSVVTQSSGDINIGAPPMNPSDLRVNISVLDPLLCLIESKIEGIIAKISQSELQPDKDKDKDLEGDQTDPVLPQVLESSVNDATVGSDVDGQEANVFEDMSDPKEEGNQEDILALAQEKLNMAGNSEETADFRDVFNPTSKEITSFPDVEDIIWDREFQRYKHLPTGMKFDPKENSLFTWVTDDLHDCRAVYFVAKKGSPASRKRQIC